MNKEIGKRIQQRREHLGLSQEELAKRVGYKSRSSINKIELDGRDIPKAKIPIFAKALNTTPAFLNTSEEESSNPLGYYLRNKRGGQTINEFSKLCGVEPEVLDKLEKGFDTEGEIFTATTDMLKNISQGLKVDFFTLATLASNQDMPTILNKIKTDPQYRRAIISNSSNLRSNSPTPSVVRINVYGRVPAGIPLEAIEDIVDWEEIPVEWTNGGQEYIALKVKGDSMSPKFLDGDTVIVRLQPDCENGQDCVVYINGYDATLKKVIKKADCVILQPLNPTYDPIIVDYNDSDKPFSILGVVVQLRRDF